MTFITAITIKYVWLTPAQQWRTYLAFIVRETWRHEEDVERAGVTAGRMAANHHARAIPSMQRGT